MLRLSAAALAASLALAAPAFAQEAAEPSTPTSQPYVGLSAGYHDLFDNPIGKDGGFIGGVVAGVDATTRTNVVIGIEGNFHLGTGAVDSEYGATARLGYRFRSGGVAYIRGGYQWVNLDISKLSGGIVTGGVDDTGGDYLVGVGGEFGMRGSNARLRVGVDTLAFDTLRPNVAVVVGF